MKIRNTILILKVGDITLEEADIIVTAANSQLAGGGGVDGAIHRAAGPELMAELEIIRKNHGGCKTGHCVSTGAGQLKAKHLLHAVGPIWLGGTNQEGELLRHVYLNCLKKSCELGAKTIAFPSISTGAYAFPLKEAAPIALKALMDHCDFAPTTLEEIRLVLFSPEDHQAYLGALKTLQGS